MSDLRSGFVGLVVAGLFGTLAVVGCSADGAGTVGDESPTEPGPAEPGAQLPGSTSGSDSGSASDAGKPAKDAATKDATVDAGPPPPVAGTACVQVDEVRKKSCGACGTQSTVCLASGDGGAGSWSDYSACEGELPGGCVPGTVVDEACGNCGTTKKTCTQYCAFTASACAGQPASSCVPGGVELSSAGCAQSDQFRSRTCQSASCIPNNFSATCAAPPTVIEVGPTPGSVTSTIAVLTQSQTLSRMTGLCPTATLSTTVSPPYVYLQVHNPLARAAVVSIYNSVAPGGVIFKTALAAYDGATGPTDDASRKTCIRGASTYGTTALTGDSRFASLDGARAVTIAAGATVSVYVGAYDAFDPLKPTNSTGNVKLNVQTVSLP